MATITGATSGVSTIPQNSSANGAVAQTLLNSIGLINGGAQTNANTLTASSTLTTTAPVVLGVGGLNPTSIGPVNLGTLQPNVVAVVINNTNTTTLATSPNAGGASIVGGNGGLSVVDNGYVDVINVGGGSNVATLAGFGGTFVGDGSNLITLAAGDRGAASTVSGTPGASDTIKGAVGATGKLFYIDAGGSALINPTLGDVTIVGGTGTETVFGTAAAVGGGTLTASVFTGSLTVIKGTGYFGGGMKGSNNLSSSTVGGTTLVGGGGKDTLSSFNTNTVPGAGDALVASGGGSSTLDGSSAVGNDNLFASNTASTLMYGSKSVGDVFFLSTSTVAGVGFTGSFVSMHTAPGSALFNLNTTVSNTIALSGGAEFASVNDFITGVDKIAIIGNQGGSGTLFTPATLGGTGYVLQTASGSNILFFNGVVKASDIIGLNVTTK